MFICPRGAVCQMHPISIIPVIWWTFVSDRLVIGVADLHSFFLVFVLVFFVYKGMASLLIFSLQNTKSSDSLYSSHLLQALCVQIFSPSLPSG